MRHTSTKVIYHATVSLWLFCKDCLISLARARNNNRFSQPAKWRWAQFRKTATTRAATTVISTDHWALPTATQVVAAEQISIHAHFPPTAAWLMLEDSVTDAKAVKLYMLAFIVTANICANFRRTTCSRSLNPATIPNRPWDFPCWNRKFGR